MVVGDEYKAVYMEDSGTGRLQPQNIAALVDSYTEEKPDTDEALKPFNMRVSEHDRARVRVLADVLGTTRAALGRELLHQALNEAFQCLPDDRKPSLDALDEAISAERGGSA